MCHPVTEKGLNMECCFTTMTGCHGDGLLSLRPPGQTRHSNVAQSVLELIGHDSIRPWTYSRNLSSSSHGGSLASASRLYSSSFLIQMPFCALKTHKTSSKFNACVLVVKRRRNWASEPRCGMKEWTTQHQILGKDFCCVNWLGTEKLIFYWMDGHTPLFITESRD